MANNNITTYIKDINSYDNIIVPMLNLKKKPIIFSSLTYLTPNYQTVYFLYNLSKLVKQGFKVVIFLSDINSLEYAPAKKELILSEDHETYLIEKENEFRKLALGFGINQEDLVIERISRIWKRFISITQPPIFFEFYNSLTLFKPSELNDKHKVAYFIQTPMNFFLAYYYHILCPEKGVEHVDIFFLTGDKLDIYSDFRSKLYSKNIISFEKPLFLILDDAPRLFYNDLMPSWDMGYNELRYLILKISPDRNSIIKYMKKIFPQILKELIVKNELKQETLPPHLALNRIKKLNDIDLEEIFTLNLFSYLSELKKLCNHPVSEDNLSDTIFVNTTKNVKDIGKVLKNEHFLSILSYCDGSKNITQIAKVLNKQISNISKSITFLKKIGFVVQSSEGYIKIIPNKIYIDLNQILNLRN
jgi:predicted transcriptional regulator